MNQLHILTPYLRSISIFCSHSVLNFATNLFHSAFTNINSWQLLLPQPSLILRLTTMCGEGQKEIQTKGKSPNGLRVTPLLMGNSGRAGIVGPWERVSFPRASWATCVAWTQRRHTSSPSYTHCVNEMFWYRETASCFITPRLLFCPEHVHFKNISTVRQKHIFYGRLKNMQWPHYAYCRATAHFQERRANKKCHKPNILM